MYDKAQIERIKNWLGEGSINLFGLPFSGKDCQGKRLCELLEGSLIGGGEILRGSLVTDDMKRIVNSGKLAPSEDYLAIISPYFKQPQFKNKPLILSSVGRWSGEEGPVIEALEESGHNLKVVVYIDIPVAEAQKRWEALKIVHDRQNRNDDDEKVLNVRFKEFNEKTIPVLKRYQDLGLLVFVDGQGTRDEVTSTILSAIDKFLTSN